MPANLDSRQAILCTSGTAQCCDVDVLGVADLDCETPPTLPANITDFNNICAGVGKIDMCCILPILNQGILCSSPSPS
ncbi:Cerato-ulmin hydrophobin family [Tricladium varicosporioides]|nr:Cerato-ulmin hydrophobin family [Hymenoscyphus varicosporioides]